jgi:hypothetical protein
MARQIRFTFFGDEVSVIADLCEEDAPKTCAAVWNALPVAGMSHHAVYSGSEGVLILPQCLIVEPENATFDVRKGDVGFTWFAAGSSFGVTESFAEICWFYDDDACPSMPEGPVPVSLFAKIRNTDAEAFYAVCRRMRREGVRSLLVERVEPKEPFWIQEVTHALVYRHPYQHAVYPHALQRAKGEILVCFTQQPREREGRPYFDPRCRPMLARSLDGGKSWSEAERIGDAANIGSFLMSLSGTEEDLICCEFARYAWKPRPARKPASVPDYLLSEEGVARLATAYQLASRDGLRTCVKQQGIGHRLFPEDISAFDETSSYRLFGVAQETTLGLEVGHYRRDREAEQENMCQGEAGDTFRAYKKDWTEVVRALPSPIAGGAICFVSDGSVLLIYSVADGVARDSSPLGSYALHVTRFRPRA